MRKRKCRVSGNYLIRILTNHEGGIGKRPSNLSLFVRHCYRKRVEAAGSFRAALSSKELEGLFVVLEEWLQGYRA